LGDFVDRYDSPTTLFYLDQPYFRSESDYGDGVFLRADFACMAIHLSAISGSFCRQRRSGNPRRVRALRDREHGHAPYDCPRHVV